MIIEGYYGGGRSLRSCRGDYAVERLGDRRVPLSGRVLVDQSGSGRGVAHADHQLLGACSRGGRQRVSGVSKIVESEVIEAGGSCCRSPLEIPMISPERSALGAREDEVVGLRAHVRRDVGLELRDEQRGRQTVLTPALLFGASTSTLPSRSV